MSGEDHVVGFIGKYTQ